MNRFHTLLVATGLGLCFGISTGHARPAQPAAGTIDCALQFAQCMAAGHGAVRCGLELAKCVALGDGDGDNGAPPIDRRH